MSKAFSDVQRIVLVGTRWQAARHLMLDFGEQSCGKEAPLRFLNALLKESWPTAADVSRPEVQFSLGFTRLGLQRIHVPDRVLTCFALKSPAYWAGAAQRAASHLGLTGANAPELWDQMFAHTQLHAVLSIHAGEECLLKDRVKKLEDLAKDNGIEWEWLPAAAALTAPPGVSPQAGEQPPGQWVHFGFRDGLSRIGIKGRTEDDSLNKCLPISRHNAGEFVLGHLPDRGADPWVAGPGLRVWPEKLRAFFHNGSFGVLQLIEQHVDEFENSVDKMAQELGRTRNERPLTDPEKEEAQRSRIREIKGKLCGRYPDGQPLVAPDGPNPAADFDYRNDPKGFQCPFGSHVRRMNPRVSIEDAKDRAVTEEIGEDALVLFPAHFSRPRPLLRRGMPYGPAWKAVKTDDGKYIPDDQSRGLIGQFFCASIENQFEHLLGQWGDRVPLGSPDEGGARDPIIGAHEPGDGRFEIPRKDLPALRLGGLAPFTRTVGAAYLFYPSLTTLCGIANSRLWSQDHKDSEDDLIDEDYSR